MKLPNIKTFTSSTAYFTFIYESNKSTNKTFSHRNFARRAKWPASYLSDLMKGRKRLTISRSLQFAKAFRLSPVGTEYLITLCLADYEDESVSSYFKDEVKNKNLKSEKKASFTKYLGLFENMRAMYLRELILWSQGQIPVDSLIRASILFPELQNKDILNETLEFLKERGMLQEIKPRHFRVIEVGVFALDDEGFTLANPDALAKHYIAQLEILSRLYKKNFDGRGFSFSGYIDIRLDRFTEVQRRMFEVRDWLISLSKESKSSEIQKNDTFHLELRFIPMFDLKRLSSYSR